LVAIDRTSKFAFATLEDKANRVTATAFLEALVDLVPYEIHTVPTDNGVQFCYQPSRRKGRQHATSAPCSTYAARKTASGTA
jgi:hypothetical protein